MQLSIEVVLNRVENSIAYLVFPLTPKLLSISSLLHSPCSPPFSPQHLSLVLSTFLLSFWRHTIAFLSILQLPYLAHCRLLTFLAFYAFTKNFFTYLFSFPFVIGFGQIIHFGFFTSLRLFRFDIDNENWCSFYLRNSSWSIHQFQDNNNNYIAHTFVTSRLDPAFIFKNILEYRQNRQKVSKFHQNYHLCKYN